MAVYFAGLLDLPHVDLSDGEGDQLDYGTRIHVASRFALGQMGENLHGF